MSIRALSALLKESADVMRKSGKEAPLYKMEAGSTRRNLALLLLLLVTLVVPVTARWRCY
jgi:hypothetical protein